MGEEPSVTLPPSVPILGGLKLTGSTAILAIMLFGAVVWVYRENEKRNVQFAQVNERFERLECKIDMGAFVHSFPKGGIDWSLLPADLYQCAPNLKPK